MRRRIMKYSNEDVVSERFGIQVIHKNRKYFPRYDGGEIAVDMKMSEVSKDEADKAQASSADAYQVLLECQRREV